jgi:arylsulfatase A-like enzyme
MRPFFLSVQYTAPHWPWQGPADPPHADTSDMMSGGSAEVFARMVQQLDRGVGRILAALEERGVQDNTLVIFTSDNGGDRYSSMGPLSGGKMQLWEGGIREPAMIRWPGVLPPGRETDQVATTMDWTATILSAARVEPDSAYPLDGIDLLPISIGAAPVQPRTLAWRTFQRTKHKALRSGDWKYLDDGQGEHLFNLAEDPGEKRDLKGSYPEQLERLKELYRAWEAQMLRPVPLP